ncbi:toll/interleukin-1 receptor domain-containing protein [Chryseobacterium gleum]|uniref:toll/interleukin-1 receptor domain-containing protein n=1 Tax=Chryseobacterium gleum TaxID=250 RepID=UPI0028ACD035|nr:toll/interleukin-1 receptor domain-containing protein [Chryseobacterium gleum]
MFYIHPTEKWIKDVVQNINEKQLDIHKSKFMIAFFSSMDTQFVEYFKDNKTQISSFSGTNFHIFTPLIYEDKIIPDDDWRFMRKEFNSLGIPVSTSPTFVFFNLEINHKQEYEPQFFAGFTCETFDSFPKKLKNAIDTSIDNEDITVLRRKLKEIFLSKNIIPYDSVNIELKNTLMNKLPKHKVFVSHSSTDKPFARKLIKELSHETGSSFWFDENEISVGDNIQETITENLKISDYLLLIISKNSSISEWVNLEINQFMGFKNGKNIIPIILSKEHTFQKPIDTSIKQLKYLDFSDNNKWQENILELKRKLNSDK